MLSGQPSLDAALGPLQWQYGTARSDRTATFEQEIGTPSSPVSRPEFNRLSSMGAHSTPTSMIQMNSSGLGTEQNVSLISPLSYSHPIVHCQEWNTPSSSSILHSGTPMNSSSSSGGSSFSSVDICDLISSLNLSSPRRPFSVSTEQEMENIRALHSLSSSPFFNTTSTASPSPSLSLDSNRPLSVNDNVEHYNGAVQFNRFQPEPFEETISWSGELPRQFVLCPTYSCKVFLGGVPWDVTEEALVILFMNIGRIRVEWPGKENSAVKPKGYVYVVFEAESQVKTLLNYCARELSSGTNENYFFRIYSKKLKYKPVQVIPWRLIDCNYVVTSSEKLDPHVTVFVGGLHGIVSAEGLYKIMDDLFGGVTYVGIDTDKFKYPIGSARVTFNNRYSYIKAIKAAFVEIKTSRFTKKVQILPYLEDAVCSNCVTQAGPFFCRDLSCFRYFCAGCWVGKHLTESFGGHVPNLPLVRHSKYNSNALSPRVSHFPR